MAMKLFLGITALAFGGYGLACLASPGIVANATGMQLATGTATVEVRAMYGGLQIAIGLLAGLAVFREPLRVPILTCLAVLFFGLVSGRVIGIAIEPDPGRYNFGAAVYEGVSAAIALALLRRDAGTGLRS